MTGARQNLPSPSFLMQNQKFGIRPDNSAAGSRRLEAIRLRSVYPNPSSACFEHDTTSHDRYRVCSPRELRQRVCTVRYSRCARPRCLDEAGRAVQVDTDHGSWANSDCRYGQGPGRGFG
jgi:hypothetical protein